MSLVVIVDHVRLRAGPGTDYAVLADLDAGAIVEPTGGYGWREVVTAGGTRGWVAVDYVRDDVGRSAADSPALEGPAPRMAP